MGKKFRKILIANRGEIALRVIRAARTLGIRTCLAHSGVDAGSVPARLADETFPLSDGASSAGYLDIPLLVRAARETGCDAVHPGYGFLSENAAFSEACEKAGIVFIGPAPGTLRITGDKLGARKLAATSKVPLTPGSEGAVVSLDELGKIVKRTGYPVFLKAAAGGGGKGIRLVEREADLASAWELARAEAKKAFGDDTVYVEKRVFPARHIEVQVIGDGRGKVLHLGERECSIQRRHQKLIEESPSPALTKALRERICKAAVAVARACRYRGAGTVEFLLDAEGRFYFMEVNARVQVEHPVTELVTGIDIVAEQIRVAQGLPLSFSQADVAPRGHAIEARICAEDPAGNFMPATGTVESLAIPGGPGIRVETALEKGQRVTPHYDSLLAKALAWGRTREEAAERLSRALRELEITGIPTTAPFLAMILADKAFLSGKLRTDFLARWTPPPPPEAVLRAAAVAVVAWGARRRATVSFVTGSTPGASAWGAAARTEGLRS